MPQRDSCRLRSVPRLWTRVSEAGARATRSHCCERGRPVGPVDYEAAPEGGRLIVNEDEAEVVRVIFQLYIEHEALLPVVKELDARGWTTKRWITRKGHERGGKPFDKNGLFRLLRNVIYLGKITYKDEVHEGEHLPIVDTAVFQRVQRLLKRNGRAGGKHVRDRFGAVLKGLLRCVPCGCAMVPTHTKKANKRYRYYVCSSAQKRGWHACPSKSIPALEIERFVVDQIRSVGSDPKLLAETSRQVRAQADARISEIKAEQRRLARQLQHDGDELREIAGSGSHATADRMADLQERITTAERRDTALREELTTLQTGQVSEEEVAAAMAGFDPVWDALAPRRQARMLRLLIERVDYDGERGIVTVAFHPAGIRSMADELATEEVKA